MSIVGQVITSDGMVSGDSPYNAGQAVTPDGLEKKDSARMPYQRIRTLSQSLQLSEGGEQGRGSKAKTAPMPRAHSSNTLSKVGLPVRFLPHVDIGLVVSDAIESFSVLGVILSMSAVYDIFVLIPSNLCAAVAACLYAAVKPIKRTGAQAEEEQRRALIGRRRRDVGNRP